MVANTSPAILLAIFNRFQRKSLKFEGVRWSMRSTSMDLGSSTDKTLSKDACALSRWTNPGDKNNWFIPLARIPAVASKLGATTAELDDLMIARLGEIAENDPGHEALVAGEWVAQRVQKQLRLDEDEQAVLAAYRNSLSSSYAVFDHAGRLAKMEAFFGAMNAELLNEFADEASEAESEVEPTADEIVQLRERAVRIFAKEPDTAEPATVLTPKQQAKRLLTRLRKGIRM
jgi:hypothetical protein